MVLGKLPVPGRPAGLDSGDGARAYCACGGGSLDVFAPVSHFSFFLPLWETVRYRLKYCLKAVTPKTANQILPH